jgi:hypothetical protein
MPGEYDLCYGRSFRFICRKLYKWFVYYEIDDATETDVIEPMAAVLQAIYDIKPALAVLLKVSISNIR